MPASRPPQHHQVGAGRQGLHDVSGIADAAVRNDGYACGAGHGSYFLNGGELGHPHTGNDAGGADGAGTHAHLDGLDARLDQVGSAFRSDYVAGHDGAVRQLAEIGNHIHHACGMACGGVDEQGVSPCGDQGLGPVQVVGAYAYGSAAAQMAVVVLGGVRKHGALLDVRFRDQAGKNAVFIHEGKLFNAVRVKDVASFFNSGAGGGGNQAGKRGHHIFHQHVFVIVHSAHIAAR